MTTDNTSNWTIEQPGQTSGGDAGSTKPKAKEMASAAASETSTVAHGAVDAGKNVAHEAANQAASVASTAKDQIGSMVHQAKGEFRSQVESRGQQAASGLQTLADQLSALASGRPQEAGQVATFLGDAQERVQSYAQTLQQRGPQALAEDVSRFARRRPVVFLVAAVATGFAAGRLVRAGAAQAKEESQGGGGQSLAGSGGTYGSGSYESGVYGSVGVGATTGVPVYSDPAVPAYSTGGTGSIDAPLDPIDGLEMR